MRLAHSLSTSSSQVCLGKQHTFASSVVLVINIVGVLLNCNSVNAVNIDQEIREYGVGENPCLIYINNTFSLTCNFNWVDHYSFSDFIMLQENEVFNGNNHQIGLNDLSNFWNGLFKINSTVEWNNSPVIKQLHMRGGATLSRGGFLVQAFQNNFTVDSCSSSGTIGGSASGGGAGGICGRECSGIIVIKNSWSTGTIEGPNTGGIAGSRLGDHGGQVIITNCWSEGGISGTSSGGISGSGTGRNGGVVIITKSYSKGDIKGHNGGGISGSSPGSNNGCVKISQCYSIGEMSGFGSGGVASWGTSRDNGHVEIENCYTRGQITSTNREAPSGGICGFETGRNNGVVLIRNVYTLGSVHHSEYSGAGGIIGHVNSEAKEVNVTMSVYNGEPMIGSDQANVTFASRNSDNLEDILGKVYCHKNSTSGASLCWDTKTIWGVLPNRFPILQAQLSSPPTVPVPQAPSNTQHRIIVLPVQCNQGSKRSFTYRRNSRE